MLMSLAQILSFQEKLYDWLMASEPEKEEWRYFMMATGELSVMILGISEMQKLFVVNSGIVELIMQLTEAFLVKEMVTYG